MTKCHWTKNDQSFRCKLADRDTKHEGIYFPSHEKCVYKVENLCLLAIWYIDFAHKVVEKLVETRMYLDSFGYCTYGLLICNMYISWL